MTASEIKIYNITPIGKPRMTQRDKWKGRPVVLRYFAYRDEVKAKCVELPECDYHVIFVIPMPKSWSKKKKSNHLWQKHQQKPDKDNLEKGLLDAIFKEDSTVWDGRASKVWGYTGAIIVMESDKFKCIQEYLKQHISI